MTVFVSALLRMASLFLVTFSVQDVEAILSKGDELMEEAKKCYEEAKAEGSVDAFIRAGFKLEEARIKFLVVQEIGEGDKSKAAADRLRASQQLAKLINDGKVAVMKARSATEAPDAPPGPPSPPEKAAPAPARAGKDAVKKLPVPEAAAVKNAERIIRDLFKEDYAKKGTAENRALARKLLKQAADTSDDPPGLYALYLAAIDAAGQGCDPETATYAVDQLSRFFDVDRLALRTEALGAAGKAAKSPEEWTSLAEAQLALADDLFLEDSYEGAEKASKVALQHAGKAKNTALTAKVTARGKEISEGKTRFVAMKGSLETLAKTPDHPGASLEMGEFLCYVKGNWDLGLRFLAKGSDATRKALAEREIGALLKPQELVDLAAEWEKLAEKERHSLSKGQIAAHVRDLYLMAHRGATGLLRAQIEKKLGGNAPPVAKAPVKAPPPAAGPGVDLLGLIDVARDKINSPWTLEGNLLLSPPEQMIARFQIPYCPPEEYDVVIVIEKRSGIGAFNLGVVAGGAQFLVAVDGFDGSVAGVGLLDGKLAAGNETTKRQKIFVDNKPKTLTYRIRKNSLVLLADNKTLIDWKADYSRCSLASNLTNHSKDALFLMSHQSQLAIHSIRLIPVSGTGRPLHAARHPNFDPVGIWIKQETGTEFHFKPDGLVEVPTSKNPKYLSGTWKLLNNTITLEFQGDRFNVTVADSNTLTGASRFLRKQ